MVYCDLRSVTDLGPGSIRNRVLVAISKVQSVTDLGPGSIRNPIRIVWPA